MTTLETTTKRPPSVNAAVNIQYFLIALSLLSAIFAATFGNTINDAVKAELDKLDATQLQRDALANVGGAGATGVIIAIVSTVVFVTLTILVAKGTQWARVTTWVLSGLTVIVSLLGVAGILLLGTDETLAAATQAGHDAVGAWYGPWQIGYLIVSLLGTIAVIVLLALPGSHPFFRKSQPETVLPPEAYTS